MAEMRRAKSQVLFRYTPKAMFRYNETNGWCEVTSIEMRNTQALPHALAEALSHTLRSWNAVSPENFPDPQLTPHKFEMGEPYQVHYTLVPLVFTCRYCRRVQYYATVDNLARNYDLRCRGCNRTGVLMQVPYMFIHECGRADSLFVPKHVPGHTIVMNNRGRFQESNWFCQTCNRPLTTPGKQGLGFRSCVCGKGKSQRGTTLQDPSVHYTQTISLVDTEDALLERASDNPQLGISLLAGLLRTSHYDKHNFESLIDADELPGAIDKKREAARKDLIARGITDPGQIDIMLSVMDTQYSSPVRLKQDQLRSDIEALVGTPSTTISLAQSSRPLREYLFTRDHPRMQSRDLGSMITVARDAHDELALERYKADQEMSDQLGLISLQIAEAFPLLLAAVGYSRVFAEPKDQTTSMLRPFITDRPKIPVYAIRNNTEAFMFELNPWWEAAWLIENGFAEQPSMPFRDAQSLRLWLLRHREIFFQQREAHFTLQPWETQQIGSINPTAAASFGLLHTISHMLIAAACSTVGFDADSLAEYLLPIGSAGVIYATGHQEFTLGGLVSAFQLNLSYWLSGAYETSQRCIYDPLCKTHGGACHACTYLRFSCANFNRTVSRSFLLGGFVEGWDQSVIGYWNPSTKAYAEQLQERSISYNK